MLSKITLLTSYSFAFIYPLCFLLSRHNPLKNNFHYFHLAMPNIISGVILVFILRGDYSQSIKILTLIWVLSSLIVTATQWKKEFPSAFLVAIPSLFALLGYCLLTQLLLGGGIALLIAGLCAGVIFSSSLYAMNLGHWYLNIHGLPIEHLRIATYTLAASLGFRLVFDFLMLFQKVMVRGDQIFVWKFMSSLDGFLLWIGILFGCVFPLISIYFVMEVLKLKNTQAATGMLFVMLSAVLLGDLTYKYFWITYGIAM